MTVEPQVNEKLIKRIVGLIELDQDAWDQREWMKERDCGTTFCFAGHAVWNAGYVTAEGAITPAGVAAASRSGFTVSPLGHLAEQYPFSDIAAELLGLDGPMSPLFDEHAAFDPYKTCECYGGTLECSPHSEECDEEGCCVYPSCPAPRPDLEYFKQQITDVTDIQFAEGLIERKEEALEAADGALIQAYVLTCSLCEGIAGGITTVTPAGHDTLVRKWAEHDAEIHNGPGFVNPADLMIPLSFSLTS